MEARVQNVTSNTENGSRKGSVFLCAMIVFRVMPPHIEVNRFRTFLYSTLFDNEENFIRLLLNDC